jgi:hypothetical protein
MMIETKGQDSRTPDDDQPVETPAVNNLPEMVTPPPKPELIRADFTFWPILVDTFSRWTLYTLYRYQLIPGWLFWVSQFLFIPLGIYIYCMILRKKIIGRLSSGDTQIRIKPKGSFLIFAFYLAILTSGLYVFYSQLEGMPGWLRIVTVVIVTGLLGFYFIMVYELSVALPKRKNKPEFLANDLPNAENIKDKEFSPDENDERVINAEARLYSMDQHVETYSLESTLFGGLAFSAFLVLVTSNVAVIGYTQTLLKVMAIFTQQLFLLDFSSLGPAIHMLAYPDSIFAALCLECLLTSLFFILVIASKIRYHSLQRQVQLLVQLAVHYDRKEDELFNREEKFINEKAEGRLASLTDKVTEKLISAEKSFDELSTTITYMSIFRTIGIFFFFSLLVSGSFLISNVLGVVVLIFIGITQLYSSVDRWVREKHILDLGGSVIPFRSRGHASKKKDHKAQKKIS